MWALQHSIIRLTYLLWLKLSCAQININTNTHIPQDTVQFQLWYINIRTKPCPKHKIIDLKILSLVLEPAHCFNHTLKLVLTYCIEMKVIGPSTLEPLSDKFLITFKLLLLQYTTEDKYSYIRSMSDESKSKFKGMIQSSPNSIAFPDITENSFC